LLVNAAALYTAIPPVTHTSIFLSILIVSPTSIPQIIYSFIMLESHYIFIFFNLFLKKLSIFAIKNDSVNLVVDFRSSHFAFRGRPPSLLDTACLRGLACLASPAGVFVPGTKINKWLKSILLFNTAKK
jgi:hypothetical protein